MRKAAVITLSDKGYKGEREDVSGAVIEEILRAEGVEIHTRMILPDEVYMISDALAALSKKCDFIFTTGGTGFSKRDVTPEATRAVIDRECDGVTAAMIFNGLQHTPRAMLTRAVCGIKGNCIILNLPGSPKAVRENLEFVLPSLLHGADILNGGGECAR